MVRGGDGDGSRNDNVDDSGTYVLVMSDNDMRRNLMN